MEGEARFVGIDVSKAQVDVTVRPAGKRPDGTVGAWTHRPDYSTASQVRARSVSQRLLLLAAPIISPSTATGGPSTSLLRGYRTPRQIYRDQGLTVFSIASHLLSDRNGYIPRWIRV